ncbi:hypothetical protein [Lentilactobacillus hilgardii]|uniref:hypothetical protein n=1 Tax=Lentilactobacillus hilgardii TaxID=1588 RepID=UPI003FA544E8
MKKRELLLTVLIAGLAGLVLGVPQPVKAAGVYRTVKSKAANDMAFHWNGTSTQAYLWNYNLTQKKHHLTNYPKTTWYATRVVKMTNGHKTGIFYYVTNQSKKIGGYVWQGYLTNGAYSGNNNTKSDNTKWVTKDNPGGVPHPTKAELKDLKGTDPDQYSSTITYYQDLPIIKSFTGTTYNHKLDDASAGKLGNNFDSVTRHEWGDKLQDIEFIKFSTQLTNQQIQNLADGSPTFKQFVLDDLVKQHINLSSYKGWQIGMFSNPIYEGELTLPHGDSYIGEYVIALYNPNQK